MCTHQIFLKSEVIYPSGMGVKKNPPLIKDENQSLGILGEKHIKMTGFYSDSRTMPWGQNIVKKNCQNISF